MFKIRDYQESDIPGIDICLESLQNFEKGLEDDREIADLVGDKYLKSILESVKSKKGKILIAEVDDNIAGFIAFWKSVDKRIFVKKEAFLFISDFVVLKEYRNLGLGRSLMEKAESFANENNIKKMELSVLANNETAVNFYRNFGFEDYEIILRKKV